MTSPTSLSVVVLVSAGRNRVSGAARAGGADLAALALAMSLASSSVRVVHAGAASEPALGDYAAYGAAAIEVVEVAANQNVEVVLAPLLMTADVVVTGTRSETGQGSGLVPYLIAEALKRPVIADVLRAESTNSGLVVYQFRPQGQRRRAGVSCPAVLAAHPSLAAQLRYAYARRVAGKVTPVAPPVLAAPAADPWNRSENTRRLEMLRAADQRNGHERMTDAITPRARGGRIVREGSALDKAQVIFNYLRDNKLVDF